MNILLVTSKYMPEYSGSGYRAHNLYKRLMAAHPDISVNAVCGSETENNCEDYEYEAIKVKRIASKKYLNADGNFIVSRLKFLCNFISEFRVSKKYFSSINKPDLIHVFGKNNVTAAAVHYAMKNKIPAIIELVCDMDSPFQHIPFPLKFLISPNFPLQRKIVCISKKLKDTCVKNGIAEKDTWLRPNPVDEKKFFPVSPDTKYNLRKSISGFGEKDKLVVYIAKFRPSKNHNFLIEVIRRLPDEFKLYMKGPIVESGILAKRDIKYFELILEKVRRFGLQDRIKVDKGFSDNVSELYQMADVYAFPSREEGLGTPVLESLACGVPVVANNIRGVTDTMVFDGKNGFLAPLDPEAFAINIMRAAKFPQEKMIAESGKIIDNAGTKIIDERYYSLLKNVLMQP